MDIFLSPLNYTSYPLLQMQKETEDDEEVDSPVRENYTTETGAPTTQVGVGGSQVGVGGSQVGVGGSQVGGRGGLV